MPYPVPTQAELNARALSDMKVRLEGSDPQLRLSFENIFGHVVAGAVHGTHKHLEYVGNQLFPDTADEEGLLKWGGVWGVVRNEAAKSTGIVTGTGAVAATVPAGTELKNAQDAIYTVDNLETVDGGGLLTAVEVTAQLAGNDQNLGVSSVLTLVSPVAGIDGTFIVDASAVDGGLDLETIEAYRIRIVDRISDPPRGGASGDYETWAKEIAGVTRAWEDENFFGFGTVRVLFARDNDVVPLPDAAEIQTVQDYLQETDGSGKIIGGVAPIFVTTTVGAYVTETLNVTVSIQRAAGFSTEEGEDSVETALKDLLFEIAAPNTTLRISQIREAISRSPAEVYHTMTAPAADVTSGASGILFLGTVNITWL